MENSFKLDYDKKTLKITYNDEDFDFDLNDGDVGDLWGSLTPKNSEQVDINFHQEDESQIPSVEVYGLNIINDNIEIGDSIDLITEYETVGDSNNYFKYSEPKVVVPKINKKQVAKLVYISMVTRVVVDEDATEEQIIETSKQQFLNKISTDLHENVEEVLDDDEMPYNKSYDV